MNNANTGAGWNWNLWGGKFSDALRLPARMGNSGRMQLVGLVWRWHSVTPDLVLAAVSPTGCPAAERRDHTRSTRRMRMLAWIGLLLLVPGCEEPTTALVTGTVTVDGEVAKTGAISFFPVDDVGTPVGTSIKEGLYSVQVPFGEKKVQVRVSKVVGKQKLYDTADSPIKEVMTEALPPKYNSATELRFDVQPGENQKDYNLETK